MDYLVLLFFSYFSKFLSIISSNGLVDGAGIGDFGGAYVGVPGAVGLYVGAASSNVSFPPICSQCM